MPIQVGQEAPDFERTMILRAPVGGTPKPPTEAASGFVDTRIDNQPPAMEAPPDAETPRAPAAPAAVEAVAKPAFVQVLSGANAGKELELTKSLTSLGKPGVQVAVIAKRPHGYFITHVQGASFPVVNGQTLDAQPHPLNDHDIIELAGIKMEFFYK